MLRVFISIFVICILVLPAIARPPLYPFDGGGKTYKYAQWVNDMNWRGEMVEIKGECDSACTMFLGADKVCIWPLALLGFHEVRDTGLDGDYQNGHRSEEGTRDIEKYYPYPIYLWVKKHNATSSGKVTYMTGYEAIKLGMPNCQKVIK